MNTNILNRKIQQSGVWLLKRSLLLTILVFWLSPPAQAQEFHRFVICKFKDEVRTLEIRPGGPEEGCEALYTKYSRTERMGWGKNLSGCSLIVDNIRKNLEAADWKCADRTEDRIIAQ